MSPDLELYRRANELFVELCEQTPSERRRRLLEVEPELAEATRRMLAADSSRSSFFDRPVERELGEEMPIPERIGEFRILGRLGMGSMGVVYEAEQEHPRRRVAIKTVHPWLQSDRFLERFRFEVQAMGRLLHPGIPQVYQAGEDGGTVYLVMERVSGHQLSHHAADRGLAKA